VMEVARQFGFWSNDQFAHDYSVALVNLPWPP